jgi:hypothetical protein
MNELCTKCGAVAGLTLEEFFKAAANSAQAKQ